MFCACSGACEFKCVRVVVAVDSHYVVPSLLLARLHVCVTMCSTTTRSTVSARLMCTCQVAGERFLGVFWPLAVYKKRFGKDPDKSQIVHYTYQGEVLKVPRVVPNTV